MKPSCFEMAVSNRLLAFGNKFVAEYRFDTLRRWKFDFAYPEKKIAIECEGGTWVSGRHSRGSGFAKDCEKYNAATVQGWKVLRYTTSMIDEIVYNIKEII